MKGMCSSLCNPDQICPKKALRSPVYAHSMVAAMVAGDSVNGDCAVNDEVGAGVGGDEAHYGTIPP